MPQRKLIWTSVMENVLQVQRQVLMGESVLDLLDADLRTRDEIYELLYSDQPGAEVKPALDCAYYEKQQQQQRETRPSGAGGKTEL